MGKVNIGVVVGMVMAEFAQVGLTIMGKSAMSNGMSNLVFVFYSNLLASLIPLPSSFIFHRSQRPPPTLPVLCGFFLLGLIGMLAQVSGYAGIAHLHLPQLCLISYPRLYLHICSCFQDGKIRLQKRL